MDNEKVDRDFIHDVLEVAILNIKENTEDEINKVNSKLDKLVEILEKII